MLKINRKNAKTDYSKIYKVYIDDQYITDIKNNEIKDIEISGKHTIIVKSNNIKSNKLDLDIDGILEVLIEPDYNDNMLSKIFTNILYGKVGIKISIKSDIYL